MRDANPQVGVVGRFESHAIALLPWAFVAWTALVVTLTTLPTGISAPAPFPHFDKLMHGLSWMVMATLATAQARTLRSRTRWILCCAALGLLTELIQGFVPGRLCDPWDLLADGTGTALGALLGSRLVQGIGAE